MAELNAWMIVLVLNVACIDYSITADPACRTLSWYKHSLNTRPWKRVRDPEKPCKIFCQQDGSQLTRTIGNNKDGTPCAGSKVIDGTCKHGICEPRARPPSCETRQGRQLQFDMCLQCGGDNSTCYLVLGTWRPASRTPSNGAKGNEFVAFIPKGSTSIKINKIGLGFASLALTKSSSATYILPPAVRRLGRSVVRIGNSVWTHHKTLRTESLVTSGPTGENILLMAVDASSKHKISYSFWAPKTSRNATENFDYAVETSARRERIQLYSSMKQDLVQAERTDTSGGGSGTNGLSRFESSNYLIGEAEQENYNNQHGLSLPRRKERDRVGPNQGVTDSLPSNKVLKNDAGFPSSKKSETGILTNPQSSGENRTKKKRKKKKRRKGVRKRVDKDGTIAVATPGPYDCYPCPRVNNRRKKFCSSDFVSTVYINRRKKVQNETRYDITVISSYRNRVNLKAREYLWVASHCRCPKLRAKRMYILMGTMEQHKDRQARLLISPTDFVRGYSLGQDHRLQQLAKTLKCSD